MSESIKLMLLEDHPLFILGLKSMLEANEGISVIATADNSADALNLLRTLTPDIVLADISMPGISGLDFLGRALKEHPSLKVVMLTAYEDRDMELRAFRSGAYAYLNKSASNDEIVDVIKRVKAGKKVLSDDQSSLVLDEFEKMSASKVQDLWQLTPMDIRFLSCLSEGMNYAEIAQQLSISETTAKRITASLLTKMGANNRTHAVSMAMKLGLI